jgi:sialidase-1
LVLRRSTDLGRTWGPITYIQDFPEGQGACEPSLLVDSRTGRVFCFYFYSPLGVGLTESEPGDGSTTNLKTVHPHVIYSDDDGLSWNAATPTDLNPQLKDPTWAGWYATSGHGIQTRSGRLLQPFAAKSGPGQVSAVMIYSDDGGTTWHKGNTTGMDIFDPKAIELNDGAIMLNMRGTSRTRDVAISRDGGLNFTAPTHDQALIDPRCNADILRYASTRDDAPRNIILFSNPADLTRRLRMTLRASYDEGRTWPVAKVIHRGAAGYSALAVLPDGTIGLLYEQGEALGVYEKIVFARLNLEWLHAIQPLLTDAGVPNPDYEWFWAWFDSAVAGSANARLVGWNDLVPPSLHSLLQVKGDAKVRSGAINGLPAVHLTDKQSLSASSNDRNDFGSLPNGFTLLLVARINDVAGSHYLVDSSAGAGIGLLIAGAPPRWAVYAGRVLNGPNHTFPTGDFQPGVFKIHTLRLDGERVEHYINGELVGGGTINDGGVPLHQWGLTLGADYRGQNSADSDLAEVLCYSKPLAEADRRAVENYLLRKYALASGASR